MSRLVDQGVMKSLDIGIKAHQALQRSHAGEEMRMVVDILQKFRALGIYLNHSPDLKAKYLLQQNHAAKRRRSMQWSVQEWMF